MYSVEYLPVALRDLVDVAEYVAGELGSPVAAERLSARLVAGAESLGEMPYRRRVYVPVRPLRREYRSLGVDSYLIFYWVDERRRVVTIARVIYGKADVVRRLLQAEEA